MPQPRIGILPTEERMAIFRGAQQLGLHPYEFGAFLSLESGPNMDPNIVGGAGGRHKGLIQFGQNEQKLYGISGKQTRAGQMPKVLQYFEDRGFKPGMDISKAYATVLGGNPNVSLQAKDSFGTSVASALPRFKPGGDLYKNAQRVLGDIPAEFSGTNKDTATQTDKPQQQVSDSGQGFEGLMRQLVGANLVPMLLQPQQQSPTANFQNFLNTFGGFIR